METAFKIGTLEVHWYGILITTGVIAAIIVAFVEAKRRGEDSNHVSSMAFLVIPLGIIGARLYHVIDDWGFYTQHPAQIIGGRGLGIFGAVIGGAFGLVLYTKWKKLNTLRWLDILAPGVILAQAIGRWGNFFNQELYGHPTNLPWAIYIDPEHRLPGYEAFSHFHPLFFYEFMWDLTGFLVLMLVGRRLYRRLLDGDIFFLYVVWYSVGRFFLEGIKINVWTLAGIPTARWITGFAIALAVAILIYRRVRRDKGDLMVDQ